MPKTPARVGKTCLDSAGPCAAGTNAPRFTAMKQKDKPFQMLLATAGQNEGIDAFRGKPAPVFTDR